MRPGARYEEEDVRRVCRDDSVVFAVMNRASGDGAAEGLGFVAQFRRKRRDVAVKDARIGFESVDVDRAREEGIQIVGVKTGTYGKRADGDEAVVVFGVGVDLVRGAKPVQRILIRGRAGDRPDRTVFYELKHAVIKRRMGIVGHGGT